MPIPYDPPERSKPALIDLIDEILEKQSELSSSPVAGSREQLEQMSREQLSMLLNILNGQLVAPIRSSAPSSSASSSPISSGSPSSFASSPVSSQGSGGGCFVATAAYGCDLHDDVVVLRQFRDRCLMKSASGRVFVSLYYRFGPTLATLVHVHHGLRVAVRFALIPIVKLTKWTLR